MRVAIACGGTGGHIYPGLTLAQTLKRLRPSLEIAFVAARKQIDRSLFSKKPYPVHYLIPCPMPEAHPLRWIPFLFKFTAAFCQAFWFQLTFKPGCLIAFGGYVSGPAVLSGILLKKPVLLHEENLVPGRANRLLASRVRRVSLGFRESARFLEEDLPVVYTGPIVRSDLRRMDQKEALDFFGLGQGKKTVLIMGGSQGSHRMNTLFLEALTFLPSALAKSLQIIHLTGHRDSEWVKGAYRGLACRTSLYPFLEAMSEAYSAADLVIGRGGAMTIAEVIFFRKPAILIPLALAGGHQRQNIQVLAAQGACLLFEEVSATPVSLAHLLERTLRDASVREAMREKLELFETDIASEHLAREVLKLLNGVQQ